LTNRTQEERDSQIRKMVETRRRNGTYLFTKEHCEKISKSSIARNSGKLLGLSNIGKKQSIESRTKKSVSQRKHVKENYLTCKCGVCRSKRGLCSKEKNPFWNKRHSIETLKKISERTKIGLSTVKAKQNLRNRPKQKFKFLDTMPEILTRLELEKRGLVFETNYTKLEGTPDIFIEPNICIFVDGCYWHHCKKCGYTGDTSRDDNVTTTLQNNGYVVIRLWEHDIKKGIFNIEF
jgi:DNA mismatch endonuclease (patch repair protein)